MFEGFLVSELNLEQDSETSHSLIHDKESADIQLNNIRRIVYGIENFEGNACVAYQMAVCGQLNAHTLLHSMKEDRVLVGNKVVSEFSAFALCLWIHFQALLKNVHPHEAVCGADHILGR